jgi:drug/metabolite transporter (DMT)-like permease
MIGVGITLGLAIVFAAVGDILFSNGMQDQGEVRVRRLGDVPLAIRQAFTQPKVLLGILAMAGYFGAYTAALAMVDVSVANPLTALSYLIATLYATVFLRERICPARAIGIVLIVLGAVFVGLSS